MGQREEVDGLEESAGEGDPAAEGGETEEVICGVVMGESFFLISRGVSCSSEFFHRAGI